MHLEVWPLFTLVLPSVDSSPPARVLSFVCSRVLSRASVRASGRFFCLFVCLFVCVFVCLFVQPRDAVRRCKSHVAKRNGCYRLPPRPRSLNMLAPSAVCSTCSPLMLSFGYERHSISPNGEKHRFSPSELCPSSDHAQPQVSSHALTPERLTD